MVQSAAGSLAIAETDEDAARRHFDAARGLYDRAGQPYWSDRSRRLASVVPA